MRLSKVKVVSIVVSLLFLSTTLFFSSYRIYRHFVLKQAIHPSKYIDTIIQTGLEKGGLPSLYLMELLNLSQDMPTHIFLFDEKKAEEALLQSPLIKKAHVEKVLPHSIYIDYSIRRPFFLLADLPGRAIDNEGVVIPIEPFFSPKKLTSVYVGRRDIENKVEEKENRLIHDIYRIVEENNGDHSQYFLSCIDISLSQHESYGRREIVLTMTTDWDMQYIRLSSLHHKEELLKYFSLRDKYDLRKSSGKIKVIDLRINDLAYIEDFAK